jgi:hypothetical protein
MRRVDRTAGPSITGTLVFQFLALLVTANAVDAREMGQPVNSIRQLLPAIVACWKPPEGSEGSIITLRFGLDHRGQLRGAPLVTYFKFVGPAELRDTFAKAALRALADCTPVNLTGSFGPIVASSVLTVRLGNRANRKGAGGAPPIGAGSHAQH